MVDVFPRARPPTARRLPTRLTPGPTERRCSAWLSHPGSSVSTISSKTDVRPAGIPRVHRNTSEKTARAAGGRRYVSKADPGGGSGVPDGG